MSQAEDRVALRIGIGLALLLLYALPIYAPPPAVSYLPATIHTPILTRLFPQVPGWWIAGRLLALLAGAALIASTSRGLPLRLAGGPASAPVWRHPWVPYLAFAAALLHLACVPFVRQLPYSVKTLYVLWMFVPAMILALGAPLRPLSPPRLSRIGQMGWCAAALVLLWIVARLVISWHSPVAADSVDMFRTLGGLVRLATTGADFMTESMGVTEGVGDIEVRGVNAVQLFFSGLPLLRLTGQSPCMWWMQVANVVWMSATALVAIALARHLIGSMAMPVAAASFLFSPFLLMVQIIPIPTAGTFLGALLTLLPVKFVQARSPIVLVLLGGIAGLTASFPYLTCMTGLALLVVAWTWWRERSVAPIFIATALVSLVAVMAPNIPSERALRDAYDWYVNKHWPMAIGEAAIQGQISPTIGDWTRVDPPGTPLLIAGTLLSPFAIPRQAIKLWGDTLYEPLSAGLCGVGLLICLRLALRRDRAALYLLALLASALLPGFVSSYDRPSLTRVNGAMVPISVLSALGLATVLAPLRHKVTRRRVTAATAIVIAASGMFVFDVVNRRILAASTYGIFMRAVDESLLDRSAFLTVFGTAHNPERTPYADRHWEADFLMARHPYIDDLLRCAPKRPIALIAVQQPEKATGKHLLFWNPALEQTVQITQRYVCQLWPNAVLYTVTDQAGLSKLYGAQIAGPEWRPKVPAARWNTRRCGPSWIDQYFERAIEGRLPRMAPGR